MDRNIERFWWSVLAGVVAVAYNADHLVCAVIHRIPLIPISGLYGCKASPETTLHLAGGVLWLIGAWWIGLVIVTAYKAAKPTAGFEYE